MQNYTKSQTRLAFVQYIFQNEFLNVDSSEGIEDFQKHFYDTNISIIDEKKEFKLKFNKNFLNKLFLSLKNNIDKKNIIDDLNGFIDINRRFEKWDNILKSIIFAIIAELLITEKHIRTGRPGFFTKSLSSYFGQKALLRFDWVATLY